MNKMFQLESIEIISLNYLTYDKKVDDHLFDEDEEP